GHLAEALSQCRITELVFFHHSEIRPEHLGSTGEFALFQGTHFFHRSDRDTRAVNLPPQMTVTADFRDQFRRERIHSGDADTMQTTADLVSAAVELTTGTDMGHDQ